LLSFVVAKNRERGERIRLIDERDWTISVIAHFCTS